MADTYLSVGIQLFLQFVSGMESVRLRLRDINLFIYLFIFYHLEGIGCREHTAEFNCCSTFCISLH